MKTKSIVISVIAIIVVAFIVVRLLHSPAPAVAPSVSALPDAGILLSNATYSFYGDTFTVADGKASIQGHAFEPGTSTSATSTPLVPVGYTLAATSTGTISSSGQPGAVGAFYREFGANIDEPVLFAFAQNADGSIQQIAASDLIDQEDAKIQSVSLNAGTITLNLLVVSPADQEKPHYEWSPTEPLTLQFTIAGSTITPLSH